jgi:hypothetical protein
VSLVTCNQECGRHHFGSGDVRIEDVVQVIPTAPGDCGNRASCSYRSR